MNVNEIIEKRLTVLKQQYSELENRIEKAQQGLQELINGQTYIKAAYTELNSLLEAIKDDQDNPSDNEDKDE